MQKTVGRLQQYKDQDFRKIVQFFIKIRSTYGENIDVGGLIPDPTTISRNVLKAAEDKKMELTEEISGIERIVEHQRQSTYGPRTMCSVIFLA